MNEFGENSPPKLEGVVKLGIEGSDQCSILNSQFLSDGNSELSIDQIPRSRVLPQLLSLQETEQLRERLIGNFLGHEMPAGQSFPRDIHRVFTPDLHHVVAPAGVSL